MINIIIVSLVAIFTLASCAGGIRIPLTKEPDFPKDCDFESLPGKEFVFNKRAGFSKDKNYNYLGWYKTPNPIGITPNLKGIGYAGKHAKKLEVRSGRDGRPVLYVAATESCEKIFGHLRNISDGENPESYLEGFRGVYFLETLEKAKALIGKEIWTAKPFGIKKARVLFTPDENTSYPRGNLDKLKVTGIDTIRYGHHYGVAPFSLIVLNDKGQVGLLPYSARDFYDSSPIDPNWDKQIVDLIKSEEVKKGMTKEQALLSWGEPKSKKLVNENGSSYERWVYDKDQYLQFKGQVLTSFKVN